MNMHLRVANNKDALHIRTLVFSILEEYGLSSDCQQTDADLSDIDSVYNRAGGLFKVLLDQQGIIIACYGLHKNNHTECELRKMYLSKAHRGKGLGRGLLDDALKEARKLGFKKMVLETATVLVEAIKLYEYYSFKQFAPEHLSSRCDDAYYLNL